MRMIQQHAPQPTLSAAQANAFVKLGMANGWSLEQTVAFVEAQLAKPQAAPPATLPWSAPEPAAPPRPRRPPVRSR